MNYYITNNETTYRLNINSSSFIEPYHPNMYSFFITKENENIYSGFLYTRQIGNEYFYSLNQKNWTRFPVNFSSKEFLGNQQFKIYSGFLPSGPKGSKSGDGLIASQMPGKISKISVKVGESVTEGKTLLVMEAMKMENEVKSSTNGIVSEIYITANQNVDSGTPLLKLSKL